MKKLNSLKKKKKKKMSSLKAQRQDGGNIRNTTKVKFYGIYD